MPSSQPKKKFYLAFGLMAILFLGLLWNAGMQFQGSSETGPKDSKAQAFQPGPVIVTKKISAPSLSEADAAEDKMAAGIRKKLPPPAPKADPTPTAPTSGLVPTPESAPPSDGPEKSQEAAPAQPPVVAALPLQEVSKQTPEKQPETPSVTQSEKAPPVVVSAAPPSSKLPEPKKTVAKIVKNGSGVYPFSLLLCSHRIQENALAMQAEFERKGLKTYIVYTDLGAKGKWWRTLYGQYKDYNEALKAIKDLNLKDVVAVKTPFANLLGDYPTESDAAGALAPLTGKGLFPYLSKGTEGSARLLVGAFSTRSEAEQHQRQLEGMGISTSTVPR
jgi:septal ring-binding cell division protein DamX